MSEKRQAQALLESEERFSKIFRASPTSIAITRLSDGTFLHVNDAFLRLVGYERGEVIGRTSVGLGLHDDTSAREKLVDRLRAFGSIRDLPVVTRTRSGTRVDLAVNCELLDLGGESCILSTANDLTDRKRLEARLAYQALLLDNVHEAILATDADFVITAWNRAAEAMYGWTKDEAIGRKVGDVIRSEIHRASARGSSAAAR